MTGKISDIDVEAGRIGIFCRQIDGNSTRMGIYDLNPVNECHMPTGIEFNYLTQTFIIGWCIILKKCCLFATVGKNKSRPGFRGSFCLSY